MSSTEFAILQINNLSKPRWCFRFSFIIMLIYSVLVTCTWLMISHFIWGCSSYAFWLLVIFFDAKFIAYIWIKKKKKMLELFDMADGLCYCWIFLLFPLPVCHSLSIICHIALSLLSAFLIWSAEVLHLRSLSFKSNSSLLSSFHLCEEDVF